MFTPNKLSHPDTAKVTTNDLCINILFTGKNGSGSHAIAVYRLSVAMLRINAAHVLFKSPLCAFRPSTSAPSH